MTAARCAICDKPLTGVKDEAGRNYAPFCSKRCADVDLQRWFTGRYAIPGAEVDADAKARTDDGDD